MIQNYFRKAAAYLTIIGTVLSYAPRIGEGQVTWTPGGIIVVPPPPPTPPVETFPITPGYIYDDPVLIQPIPPYTPADNFTAMTNVRRAGHRAPQYLGIITREPERPTQVKGLENILLFSPGAERGRRTPESEERLVPLLDCTGKKCRFTNPLLEETFTPEVLRTFKILEE